MPLGNDIFVQTLYKGFFQKSGLVEKDNENFYNILNPVLNAKKAIIFVQGKFAVGIGALSITFSAINQANSTIGNSINDNYIVGNTGGEIITQTTTLKFENALSKNFSHYTDEELNTFSEIMSQLLTMYVDGVKEPYAVLMNITLQTANVVDYMIKNGLSAATITKFLSQPLIKEYLSEQKINESIYNKNAGTEIKDKKKFIASVLAKNKIDTKINEEVRIGFTKIPVDFKITSKQLEYDLLADKLDLDKEGYNERQVYYLQHFLELQDLSQRYGNFLKTQNSDTEGWSDSQDIIADKFLRNNIEQVNLVPQEVINYHDQQGLISPFYKYGRTLYNQLFGRMYMFSLNKPISDLFNQVKLSLAERQKGTMKERLMSTFDNDFVLFLTHNLYFKSDDFNNLIGNSSNSVAKRVKRAKDKYPDNIFLKMLQPEINVKQNNIKVDLLRLYEKKLDGYSANDVSKSFEEFYEIDPQLYEDIIKVLYFQNGFNQGIYNFFNVVPEGKSELQNEDNRYLYITQNIMRDTLNKYNKLDSAEQQKMFDKFRYMFDLNNPRFLKTRYNEHKVRKGKDQVGNTVFKIEISKGKEQTIQLLGNSSIKNYNLGNFKIPNKVEEKKVEPTVEKPNIESETNIPNQNNTENKETPSFIYNQLGDKTQTNNVIIKSVFQEEGVNYAKSIGGIFSLRRNNSDKHFGNPFSSDKRLVKQDNLIQTNSTKESVERYIDWVLNSQEERANWIREQLKSGKLKGKPIVYYKELGEPSHANALDYLINKYNWNNTENIKGIEISSYSNDLGFALTNPTHTSPQGFEWKRNWTPSQLKWREYLNKGIEYDGKTYKDVEQAYQQNKSKFSKEKTLFDEKTTEDLMIELLKIKLQTYPKLVEEITKLGGSEFILKSTHQPTTKNSFWETGGQNGFIKSLNQAYISVINKNKPNQKGIDETLNDC